MGLMKTGKGFIMKRERSLKEIRADIEGLIGSLNKGSFFKALKPKSIPAPKEFLGEIDSAEVAANSSDANFDAGYVRK